MACRGHPDGWGGARGVALAKLRPAYALDCDFPGPPQLNIGLLDPASATLVAPSRSRSTSANSAAMPNFKPIERDKTEHDSVMPTG